MFNVSILGATGYTGIALINIALSHPLINIVSLSSASNSGQNLAELYPHLTGANLPVLTDNVDYTDVDCVFCCLPHATSQAQIAKIPQSTKVIDLSADFRIKDPAIYEKWYGVSHNATALQQEAVYGLSDYYSSEIKQARLVANPGCYPTSILLPILPLVANNAIAGRIIADAKSGVTGAGKSLRQNLTASMVQDNFSAYGVGSHRHYAEIEQELSINCDDIELTFTPHLLPINRGILSTIYIKSANTKEQLYQCLQDAYKASPFIHFPNAISTNNVRGSNNCHIKIDNGYRDGEFIITSVIDNLLKGASSQALHNFNLIFALEETLGIPRYAMVP
jgi:N-acetyl-gamma-glutamyl-phosphate reductase